MQHTKRVDLDEVLMAELYRAMHKRIHDLETENEMFEAIINKELL
jgi:hypothetical protein